MSSTVSPHSSPARRPVSAASPCPVRSGDGHDNVHSSSITLLISSKVVIPSIILCSPSSNKVLAPLARAASIISASEAPLSINALVSLPMTRISKIPVLPRYPVWPQKSHPLPLRSLVLNGRFSFSSNPFSGWYSVTHLGHSFLTRRWANEQFTTEDSRSRATPRSRSLVIAPTALFVCRVLKTRCPLRAARTAISAVSQSLISPT